MSRIRQAVPGTWIVGSLALSAFLLLSLAVYLDSQPYFAWDLTVSRAVQSISEPWLVDLMRAVSAAGDDALLGSLLVALACICLVVLHARREALILLAVVFTAQVLKIAIKNLIARPRPMPEQLNVLINAREIYSFPSGHTVHYTVFFGFLLILTLVLVRDRATRWLLAGFLAGLIVFVGPSRIYLGAHWASDVVGGYLLGAAVLAAGIGVCRNWRVNGSWQPDETGIPT